MANKVLNLDFSKDPIATPIIYGRVGDSDMQTITINISKRDEVANLIGGVIAFEGVPCGGKVKVFDSNNIASTNNGLQKGTFEYTFPSKAFSVAGVYERAYFSFTKGNQRDTTGDFKIIVQSTADIDSDEAETIITEYNKLVSQLNSAYQNALNRMNSDYNNISRRIQSINSDLNQLQTRIEGIIGNAQSNISSKISEASTSLTNIAQSVKNEISSALAELRAADFYNKFESDNKFLSKNDASIIYSQKNKVVDNVSNQSIDGFKNFLQTPTVNGVNLAKETFGITLTGGQLGRVEVKDGTILKWGTP
ncbi:TPA: BppU family phage baseplate upper protein, partial [Enterococcus faecium]